MVHGTELSTFPRTVRVLSAEPSLQPQKLNFINGCSILCNMTDFLHSVSVILKKAQHAVIQTPIYQCLKEILERHYDSPKTGPEQI